MIVLVAPNHDEVAAALLARFGSNAALLTPSDLSRPGWEVDPIHPQAGRAVIAGEKVPYDEIEGVVTLVIAIDASDIPLIATEDREYAAAEMTAFLHAWLCGLSCPILNRPSEYSLCGPAWSPERWVLAASAQQIPVWPLRRRSDLEADESSSDFGWKATASISVVGAECVGEVSNELKTYARRLATASGAAMLGASFATSNGRTALCFASPIPDLSEAAVADAVVRHFTGGPQ